MIWITIIGTAAMFFLVGFYAGFVYADNEWKDTAYKRGWWPPKERK